MTIATDPSGQKVTYSCLDATIPSGGVWPDPAGSVVGLHLPEWMPWARSTSWSLADLTSAFQVTDRITVEDGAGAILKGVAP